MQHTSLICSFHRSGEVIQPHFHWSGWWWIRIEDSCAQFRFLPCLSYNYPCKTTMPQYSKSHTDTISNFLLSHKLSSPILIRQWTPSRPPWLPDCETSRAESKARACRDVYASAQDCPQSYTELFDRSQHCLASVYLCQFPKGFVCSIRAALRRKIPTFSISAATQRNGPERIITWNTKMLLFDWLNQRR